MQHAPSLVLLRKGNSGCYRKSQSITGKMQAKSFVGGLFINILFRDRYSATKFGQMNDPAKYFLNWQEHFGNKLVVFFVEDPDNL